METKPSGNFGPLTWVLGIFFVGNTANVKQNCTPWTRASYELKDETPKQNSARSNRIQQHNVF